jgi:hypothetical protein
MPRRLRRTVTVAALSVGTVLASALLLSQLPAGAAALGSVAVSPAPGTTASAITLTTSGPCTDANASNVQARISGSGFPAAGQNISSVTAIDSLTTTSSGGYALPLSQTLRDYGNTVTPPVVFSGTYVITVFCRSRTSTASLGDFNGSLTFTSGTDYAAQAPPSASPSAPAPASASASGSPSASASPSGSASASASPSGSPSASARPSASPTVTASPTPAPTATASATSTAAPVPQGPTLLALDASGSPLDPNPELTRGQRITIKATGFVAGESVTATVFSAPRLLGSTLASSAGLVSYSFTVPADLAAGSHTLQLGGRALTAAFAFHVGGAATVTSTGASTGSVTRTGSGSALPFTGADLVPALLLGLLLLWAGAMVVMYAGAPAAGASRHQRPAGRHARPRG